MGGIAKGRGSLVSSGLGPFTAMSLVLHTGLVVFLSFLVPAPEKAVFADPIYSVAFYDSPRQTQAPPPPVTRHIVREKPKPKEAKSTPKREVKPKRLEEVAVKPKVQEKAQARPKEPPLLETKKQPIKAPAKKPETLPEDTVENTVEKIGDVSLGFVDQKDFRHNYYLERIRALLAGKWRAPAGKRGTLKATIHFFIDRNGAVRNIELRGPSGSTLYDRSAANTVRGVERFPPLPQSYSGSQIGISVIFQTVRGGEE